MQRGGGRADPRRGSRIALRLPAAVIAAGGRGERAASHTSRLPKQLRLLAGHSLLARAVDLFVQFGCREIVAVVPADLVGAPDVQSLPASVTFAAGGDTRQASVAAGLALVTASEVIVHDAARPLATPALVGRVVEALDGFDGAVPALPVEDTLKQVTDEVVTRTVAREGLWRAQTPQAFVTAALREAHARAHAEGFVATDDAQLIERFGGRIAVVAGEPENLKVTCPADFDVAEALLSRVEA